MGMQLIETIEVGSGGAASIEFTGIPQDGVDLQLVLSGRSDRNYINDYISITLNGDTVSTNYTRRFLVGDSTTATSVSASDQLLGYGINGSTSSANTFGNASIYISNYTSATAKSISADVVQENNTSAQYYAYQTIVASSYSGTSAITQLLLNPGSLSAFVQYSTASLYKITAD